LSHKNIVLADLDNKSNFLKNVERAAALIYAHFKKEFGSKSPDSDQWTLLGHERSMGDQEN
jgi:hypothetical protein